jgi:hypothetical protein
MGVRPKTILALAAVGAVVAACTTHGPTLGPPQVMPLSAREAASEAAIQARVDAKLRAGWIYQIRGTAHGATVSPGKDPRFTFGPGDAVAVVLVPNTEPRYLISGTGSRVRTAQALPIACDGCDDGAGNPTPSPQPTPPPNYSPCASSGGATWFNNSTGEGGCVPRGGSKGLSCGAWSWSSRGKGTLTPPGGIPLTDFDWITVNADGSCDLGYFH